MQAAIDETDRKREKQLKYNEKHGITPAQIKKSVEAIHGQTSVVDRKEKVYADPVQTDIAADPVVQYMTKDQLKKAINQSRKLMEKAAKELNFPEAAKYRDEMYALEKIFKEKYL